MYSDKTRKLITPLALLLFSGLFILSCKKKEDPAPGCTAGTGGSINLHIALMHHAALIPNYQSRPDTVWIKYCQSGWNDSTPTYDTHFIGVPGEDSVFINGMKPGQYFFRGSGYDSTIFLEVHGGTGYYLDGNTNPVILKIPVTEN